MLDDAENVKAVAALKNAKSRPEVTLSGTRHGHTIDVESISPP